MVASSSFGSPPVKAFYTPAPDALEALVTSCVEACLECSASCTNCADAFVRRDGARAAGLACMRTNWNCADLCLSTARIVTKRDQRDSIVVRAAIEACIAACTACAEECDRHADVLLNCVATARATRRCADACRQLLERL